MPLIVTAVVVDLDDTTVRFVDNLKGFFDIWSRFRVSDTKARQTTQALIDQAQFSFDRIIGELRPDRPKRLPSQLNEWLDQTLRAYEDTEKYFSVWSYDVPVIILTAGNEVFQLSKLISANISYQAVYFASPQHTKAEILLRLLTKHGAPLVFIDDLPENLDQVRIQGISANLVINCHMQRPDRLKQPTGNYPHHLVHDFEEVDRLIRK